MQDVSRSVSCICWIDSAEENLDPHVLRQAKEYLVFLLGINLGNRFPNVLGISVSDCKMLSFRKKYKIVAVKFSYLFIKAK